MQNFANEFGSSLAANGYQKLPSGLIIQWGNAYIPVNGTTFNFSIAFPNSCASLVITGMNDIGGVEVMNPDSIGPSGFVASATFAGNYRYIAIGY